MALRFEKENYTTIDAKGWIMVLAGFALGRSPRRPKEMDIVRGRLRMVVHMVPPDLKDILNRYERSGESEWIFWDVMQGLARGFP